MAKIPVDVAESKIRRASRRAYTFSPSIRGSDCPAHFKQMQSRKSKEYAVDIKALRADLDNNSRYETSRGTKGFSYTESTNQTSSTGRGHSKVIYGSNPNSGFSIDWADALTRGTDSGRLRELEREYLPRPEVVHVGDLAQDETDVALRLEIREQFEELASYRASQA